MSPCNLSDFLGLSDGLHSSSGLIGVEGEPLEQSNVCISIPFFATEDPSERCYGSPVHANGLMRCDFHERCLFSREENNTKKWELHRMT